MWPAVCVWSLTCWVSPEFSRAVQNLLVSLCAKYKFAERSHNFLLQSHMQLIFGDLSDLDKLLVCVKGKSILEFRSVSKGNRKMQKNWNRAKKDQQWFDWAALWRVYVYSISSTSMQKQNPLANSVRQIKIRCATYKFAKRSDNFLMQSLMQLMFGDFWDLDNLQICSKEKNHFGIPFRFSWHPKDPKNCNRAKNTKKMVWPSRPLAMFEDYMFIWLVQHPLQKENPVTNSVAPDKNLLRKIQICGTES